MTMKNNVINPRFAQGQKVIIKPVSETGLSHRENELNKYSGQVGQVTKYYWISPRTGQVFYIYNVRVDAGRKEIVVYEDEMEPALS
jgi:transglutaminase-like putative cysteine protease